MSSLPLAGRRVLVTRAAHQAGKLSDGLRALGAEPVEVPVLEIRPPESFEALDRALMQIPQYDWLIFTSTNTVRAVVERAAELGVDLAPANGAQIAAVGGGTASGLRNCCLWGSSVPDTHPARSFFEGLSRQLRGAPGPLR